MRNITYQGADDESRTDELGPVVPRTFPPAPGWSADGHRIKAHMDYCRGPELDFVHFLSVHSKDIHAIDLCGEDENTGQITYRGHRPDTADDWRFLYESIKRSMRLQAA